MVVDGKKLEQHVEVEQRSRGVNGRLSHLFWTPLLRAYNVTHNPVEDMSFAKQPIQWNVSIIDALTDCHSESRS